MKTSFNISVKIEIAKKFRAFSKRIASNHSEALLVVIDFFNENGISPAEILGPRMETLENRISMLIKRRMNGKIAIMKDIVKNQTKPTTAMLQSLFEQAESAKKKLMVEKNDPYLKKEVSFREKIYINKEEED